MGKQEISGLGGYEIKLAENGAVPEWIEYIRTGKFQHARYGKFEITSKVLAEMKSNLDNNVRGIDVALDYYHEDGGDASGWIKAAEVRGDSLWVKVEWTPRASRKLAEKELRYFSPDFGFSWTHPETGKTFKNVIFGGGLTNRPFIKEMQPITAAEERESMNELEKAKAEIERLKGELDKNVKLAEAMPGKQARIAELEKQISDAQAELAKLKGDGEKMLVDNKKLSEENVMLKSHITNKDKEAEFSLLLSEGKACAAQKDAYMKGDTVAFAKLAEKVNIKPNGNGGTDDGDHADRVLKLAEEKRKADPKLSQGDAISLALAEVKK